MLQVHSWLQVFGAAAAARVRAIGQREDGATAAEYGLLVALIALVIVVGVGMFGDALDGFFQNLAATVGEWG